MSESLRRQYRILLYAFPAQHRREYYDEMLGVLLDRADPDQRRPTIAEAANLLTAAIGVRLRVLHAAFDDDRWRAAAAIFATLSVTLLASLGLQNIAAHVGWTLVVEHTVIVVRSWPGLVHDLSWLIVLIAILVGWRAGAAALAWMVTLAEAVTLADHYRSLPTEMLYGLRSLTLALLTCIALTMSVRHRPGPKLLGRWNAATLLLAGLLLVATEIVRLRGIETFTLSDGRVAYRFQGQSLFGPPYLYGDPAVATLYLAATVLLLKVLASLAGPLRRRVLAASLPVAALYLVIKFNFPLYTIAAYQSDPPRLLDAGQWLQLALTPIGALTLGIALIHRWERRRPNPAT